MKMLRHYFISDNLDDLEVFEEQLESAGVSTPQIHVLSNKDSEVEHHHHLHEVQSLMKKDVVQSMIIGSLVGIAASTTVIGVAYFTGLPEKTVGWAPFIFLAIVLLGFCTWEGGFLGIQLPNRNFRRFEKILEQGKHIFFVDLEPQQENILEELVKKHPGLEMAGTGASAPHWIITLQKKLGMVRHS